MNSQDTRTLVALENLTRLLTDDEYRASQERIAQHATDGNVTAMEEAIWSAQRAIDAARGGIHVAAAREEV